MLPPVRSIPEPESAFLLAIAGELNDIGFTLVSPNLSFMSVVECPHCHRNVLPKHDKSCPSCGLDTSDLSGTDPSRSRLAIKSRQKLPPVCVHCGAAAVGTMAWTRKQNAGKVTAGSLFAGFLLNKLFSDKSQTISIAFPVCPKHIGGKIEAVHEDFENYRASFLVHRNFKTALS